MSVRDTGFYDSKPWRKVRHLYILEKNGLCERHLNKEEKEYEEGNTVHHIIYLTLENMHDEKIAYDFNNLELLCPSCHSKEHHGGRGSCNEGYRFNKKGEIEKWNLK